MNDDEKKPVAGEGDAEASNNITENEETKVTVKFDGNKKEKQNMDDDKKVSDDTKKSDDSDSNEKAVDEVPDLMSALKEGNGDDEPDEELSDLDKELGRIEGIESAETYGKKPVDDTANDVNDTDEVQAEGEESAASVDLDPVTPDIAKENTLVAAMRQQEKDEKSKKGKTKVFIAILSVLLVAAIGGAVYFYMQATALGDEKAAVEAENSQLASRNSALKINQAEVKEQALKEAKAELEKAAQTPSGTEQQVSDYVTINELGVRYKKTDRVKDLIYGYTVTSDSTDADAVAFSTVTLARLVQRNGASATYPCGFTGSVPTITRYKKDTVVGSSTASKIGKKLGDAYYVYAAPVAACTNTNAQDITARDAAAKAVYDSLEVIPAATSTAR